MKRVALPRRYCSPGKVRGVMKALAINDIQPGTTSVDFKVGIAIKGAVAADAVEEEYIPGP